MIYAFTMYGMGGAALDGGWEQWLVSKLKAMGINTAASPYQWTNTQIIANAITALPPTAKVIIGGDSLGACSTPMIANAFRNYPGRISYIFGFQPSVYGNNVDGYAITAAVKVARCVYNPNWLETLGLGAVRWALAPGNEATDLRITERADLHPGENLDSETIVLNDIKGIMS